MGASAKTTDDKSKHVDIKNILVSQPRPQNDNSPYFKLAEKYNITIDFRKFIQIEEVPFKEFRKEKIDILSHSAIVFTSRNAVDNFFRVCEEAKVEVPSDMKYFCISEQTANYLQKYIVIRKRKIFTGAKTASDLTDVIKKHSGEKYLFPCSNIRKDDIPKFFRDNKIAFTEAVLYKTVASDLSNLKDVNYDMIAFFSPSGVNSLLANFPEFEQNDTRIAAFGPTTSQAVLDAGLTLDVQAPQPNAPSMTGAIELYIKSVNKGR